MAIPLSYNLRSLRERPVSTLATAFGMALVVAVFVAMSALAEGFRAALVQTGSKENVVVLRKGATSEMESSISRENSAAIAASPFVATNKEGRPLVSPEIYVVVNLPRLGLGIANVVVRGVSPFAFEVRRGLRITEGRMYSSGASEVIVGEKIVKRFANCGIGQKLSFAGREWAVVGHFEAGGSAFESEVWGENEQLMPALNAEAFGDVIFRMKDPSAWPAIEKALEADPRLQVDAHQELDFYDRQSRMLGNVLRFIAVFVTAIMAIGAVFGAVNTMQAAVASRAPEIAVLLTLGFRPASVLTSFLAESIAIALLGGLLGCLLALPINGIVTSTTNWSSFSEIAFAFRVTPDILIRGVLFALVMGAVGGFFPALRAARQSVVTTLRQG